MWSYLEKKWYSLDLYNILVKAIYKIYFAHYMPKISQIIDISTKVGNLGLI